ncbi:MAG: hypothetical protein ABI407_02035 [Bradyrhizobium sp.]
MKPSMRVCLSEHMATRLAAAVKNAGTTNSALVEAALDRFLDSDGDVGDAAMVAHRLSGMSRQLERLDRDLRIVNETVALQVRFQLAVTPPLPAAAQPAACRLGSERFEELAAQVARRVDQGTPLMRETIDRLNATSPNLFTRKRAEHVSFGTRSVADKLGFRAPTAADNPQRCIAAVREDGSNGGFPEQTRSSPHRCRRQSRN